MIHEPLNGRAPVIEETTSFPSHGKVALIGKSPVSIGDAPFSDRSWEIWTLGDVAIEFNLPRTTRHFELHDLDSGYARWRTASPKYESWLREHDGPALVIGKAHTSLPRSRVYPLADVVRKFGGYHNSTVSLMIALALYEGVGELGLFGIDMADSDSAAGVLGEYQHQRPSCEFFLGIAAAMGVKLHIPETSELLKASRVYGIDSEQNSAFRKREASRRKAMASRRDNALAQWKHHRKQMREWQRRVDYYGGALDDIDYTLRRLP